MKGLLRRRVTRCQAWRKRTAHVNKCTYIQYIHMYVCICIYTQQNILHSQFRSRARLEGLSSSFSKKQHEEASCMHGEKRKEKLSTLCCMYILYVQCVCILFMNVLWIFPPHPNFKKSSIYKNFFIVNHTILCGSLNKWGSFGLYEFLYTYIHSLLH